MTEDVKTVREIKTIVSPDTGRTERIPPGQYETKKFPVLTYGDTPQVEADSWTLRLFGLVEREITLDRTALLELPRVIVKSDFHCVTRWSKLDNVWEGVQFSEIVKLVKLDPKAVFVMQHCYGGYTTNLPLSVMLEEDVLLAFRHNDTPLETEHGGPVRCVVPRRYAWKSAKWISGFEFLEKDRTGFWEQYGYNNNGDPWTEERYW